MYKSDPATLVDHLRDIYPNKYGTLTTPRPSPLCAAAADEIVRLRALVAAQTDVEPVAWKYESFDGDCWYAPVPPIGDHGLKITPLYTHPTNDSLRKAAEEAAEAIEAQEGPISGDLLAAWKALRAELNK
jgi:hypothetical protein